MVTRITVAFLFFVSCIGPTAYGQALDSIYLHSGAVIGCRVQEEHPYILSYTVGDAEVLKLVSLHAVARVAYEDDSVEIVTPFISVKFPGDWENVLVLQDKLETAGLVYSAELCATGGGKYVAQAEAEEQALQKLKKEAAKLGCPFIMITASRVSESGHVGRKVRKTAVAYRY